MTTSYQQLIDKNMVDAFEYMERIIDFIDEKYKTTYNNCNMCDGIEELSDTIKNRKDFETVEILYTLACEKYPLIKDVESLNPKLRLVNSRRVFNKPFDELLDYIGSAYDSNDFDEKYNEVLQMLIHKFPKCEKVIRIQMELEDILDERDDIQFIPMNEIIDEEYRKLYEYVQSLPERMWSDCI